MKASLCTLGRFSLLLFGVPPHVTAARRRSVRLPSLRYSPIAAMTGAVGQPPFSVRAKTEIELTEVERKIFDHLLATLSHCRLQTELRVAGGWVRDKLLGKESYDIDIAIDNMLGSEFVDKVMEYLSSTGEVAQGVGVIPRNPDQSKHLETARMRLCDLWVDFVNLRCEDYAEDSRIPTMAFGTAREDAYRRDLTINSLFYNINTGTVEDFTERGIKDLQSGRIVTPLPPKLTFLDDPLRVLRSIRFGARFGFDLDDELKEAAACEEVKNALSAKISKERIGTEIDLMISGNQPVKALMHITDLSLFAVVFAFPSEFEPRVPQDFEMSSLAYMDSAWELFKSIGSLSFADDEKRIALYAAMFLPLRSVTYTGTKGKKLPVVSFILKDSLKRRNSDSEMVIKVQACAQKFLELIPLLTSDHISHSPQFSEEYQFLDISDASKLRVMTGVLLREVKEFWRVALLISALLYMESRISLPNSIGGELQLAQTTNLFNSVVAAIKSLELENVWEVKPLVNGKDIMQVLQLKSGGPIVSEWQQKVMAWQLAYPLGTAEECVEWMRESHLKRSRYN